MISTSHRRASPEASRAALARPSRDMAEMFAESVRGSGWSLRSPQAITVALLEVDDWHPWLAEAITLLSGEEAGRVQRRRFAADRDALALAYALHRLLLGCVLDVDPANVALHRDARGCPRVTDDTAFTSLSHGGGLVALAVTTSGPVGVDIEPRARAAAMPEIARAVCHGSEAAALAGLDEPARAAALLALWVRKEALLKAAGIGLAVAMDTFAAPEHRALVLPALFAGTAQVRMLDAGSQAVAAVAGTAGAAIACGWLRPATAAHPGAGARGSAAGLRHVAATTGWRQAGPGDNSR